jgi:hypothetical protein
MDFVGVLLEIFTIYWVLLQRERVRGLILMGWPEPPHGQTVALEGGPATQEPYNKQNKILLYYFNFYLF